jgi:NAD(P)-dependent dehydrogenase (short-subunit alcohol dehydrogenase family)
MVHSYVITGASRGLGLEFVNQLSQNKSNIVFGLVRSPETATALQALAHERPYVHIIKADVTKPASLLAAAEQVSSITHGSLDVLIHNAYGQDDASALLTPSAFPFDEEKVEAIFKPSFDVNVYGTLWTTNAFLPLLKEGELKKVVNITTGGADLEFTRGTGLAAVVAYSVAKAASNMITAKYAVELHDTGIKFLSLAPGWADTAQGEGIYRICT